MTLAALTAVLAASPCSAGAQCGLTCPADISASNAPDQCGAVITYSAPVTTGSCGTVTCAPASGSFFPVDITTVTCSATGAPQPQCMFTVTINDTQPPTITCPPTQRRQGTGPVSFPPPVQSDNCPLLNASVCIPPSGSVFPLGNSTDTCTATDGSGNTASCAFAVDVAAAAGAPALGATALAVLIAMLGAFGAYAARRRPARLRVRRR